ncbi:hypothetical protein EJ06DRAFT_573733, partial [Trichodelitschia bisporula]
MLVVHGLGGTGKTQIALQFAYWVKENDPQCSVFWISAVSEATFTQDCSHIASKLSLLSDQNKDKDVKNLVKEYLNKLLTELEFIPLAIAQAAAYIARNSMSISEYLQLLRNTDQDMADLMSAEFTDRTRPQSASNAIANTWSVSFEQIRQTDQTAANLLAFVSYIEPKAIPRSILPPVPTKARLVSAIGTLLGYAFFTKRDDNTYDMHRLVQKATKIWLDKHPLLKEEARKEAVEHLADVFPDTQDSYDNFPMGREYLPHALKVAQSAQGEDLASHYTLCKLLGHFFMWDGRRRESATGKLAGGSSYSNTSLQSDGKCYRKIIQTV